MAWKHYFTHVPRSFVKEKNFVLTIRKYEIHILASPCNRATIVEPWKRVPNLFHGPMFGKTKIKIFLFPIKKLIIWATSFPGPLLFPSPGGEEERPWERGCKNSRAFVPVRLANLNPCFCAWDSFSRFVFKVIRQLLRASSMYSGFQSKNQSYCSD